MEHELFLKALINKNFENTYTLEFLDTKPEVTRIPRRDKDYSNLGPKTICTIRSAIPASNFPTDS